MFDPVHRGHLNAALFALHELGLDDVRLMPCSRPVHRENATASDADRLAMLQIAVGEMTERGQHGLLVDDRECRREGPSWMVTSLESMKAEQPDSTLCLVLGTDSFATLETWHHWRHLFQLCHLVVIQRPGAQPRYSEVLQQCLREREADDTARLKAQPAGLIHTGLSSDSDLSSTLVRKKIEAGLPVSDDDLPAAVYRYIAEHGLYQS